MISKRLLLLGLMIKSRSGLNILRHSKDKKRRGKVIGEAIGFGMLDVVLLGFCILVSLLFGFNGYPEMIPMTAASVVIMLSFILTIFRTNGYLFNFKEYDMLMAMPFSVKDVVSSKFLYMYYRTNIFVVFLSLSMLAGYCISGNGSVISAIVWIVLSFFLPIVPMILASALGMLIAKVGSLFKHKVIIQTVLTVILVMPAFFMNYFMNRLFANGDMSEAAMKVAGFTGKVGSMLPGVNAFTKSVIELSILHMILIIAVSVVVFEVFFFIVSKFYRQLNSKLSAKTKHTKYVAKKSVKRTAAASVAYKEFKRFTGSANYMSNVVIGIVMIFLVSIGLIILNFKIPIKSVLYDAPFSMTMVYSAIPLVVYFMTGMVSTTAVTPSLEGKNYWIMKSLPIDPKDDAKGKMIFNMWVELPVSLFATLVITYFSGAGFVQILLNLVLMTALCVFSTVYGLVCGLKHRRLDWENEIEVIKQGMAVTAYIIPHMVITMVVGGLSFAISYLIDPRIVSAVLILIMILLTCLSYLRVRSLIKKGA